VNTAAFSIQLDAPLAALKVDALKACRNADQCFTGSLPDPNLGGNTISFTANSWDGPSAWSQDGWQTIEYSWGSTTPGSLHDGDRFSLSFLSGETEVLLFEQAVTFEVVQDCAGSCLYARYEVQGANVPVGGAPNTGDAGASGSGPEAGSAGEGGAPSL